MFKGHFRVFKGIDILRAVQGHLKSTIFRALGGILVPDHLNSKCFLGPVYSIFPAFQGHLKSTIFRVFLGPEHLKSKGVLGSFGGVLGPDHLKSLPCTSIFRGGQIDILRAHQGHLKSTIFRAFVGYFRARPPQFQGLFRAFFQCFRATSSQLFLGPFGGHFRARKNTSDKLISQVFLGPFHSIFPAFQSHLKSTISRTFWGAFQGQKKIQTNSDFRAFQATSGKQ